MENIQAIETRYKGYRFRSRLEARWAVFFDRLPYLNWTYEPEGYYVGPERIPYLPDFWIRQWECFVEIKPYTPIFTGYPECQLLDNHPLYRQLAQQSGKRVILIAGNPWIGEFRANLYEPDRCPTIIRSNACFAECTNCLCGRFIGRRGEGDTCRMFIRLDEKGSACCDSPTIKSSPLIYALKFARAARFEHGESPDKPRGKRQKLLE